MKTSRATLVYVALLTISLTTGEEQNGTSIGNITDVFTLSNATSIEATNYPTIAVDDTFANNKTDSPSIAPVQSNATSIEATIAVDDTFANNKTDSSSIAPVQSNATSIEATIAVDDTFAKNKTDSPSIAPVQNITNVSTLSNATSIKATVDVSNTSSNVTTAQNMTNDPQFVVTNVTELPNINITAPTIGVAMAEPKETEVPTKTPTKTAVTASPTKTAVTSSPTVVTLEPTEFPTSSPTASSDFMTEAPVAMAEDPVIMTEAPVAMTEASVAITEAPVVMTKPQVAATTPQPTLNDNVFGYQAASDVTESAASRLHLKTFSACVALTIALGLF